MFIWFFVVLFGDFFVRVFFPQKLVFGFFLNPRDCTHYLSSKPERDTP